MFGDQASGIGDQGDFRRAEVSNVGDVDAELVVVRSLEGSMWAFDHLPRVLRDFLNRTLVKVDPVSVFEAHLKGTSAPDLIAEIGYQVYEHTQRHPMVRADG